MSKPRLHSGDRCPGCLINRIVPGPSIAKENLGHRIQYFYCEKKCGWSTKQIVSLVEAPRQQRPRSQLKQEK